MESFIRLFPISYSREYGNRVRKRAELNSAVATENFIKYRAIYILFNNIQASADRTLITGRMDVPDTCGCFTIIKSGEIHQQVRGG
jgi:hypothetical protein